MTYRLIFVYQSVFFNIGFFDVSVHLRLVCFARFEIFRNELDNPANTSQKYFAVM